LVNRHRSDYIPQAILILISWLLGIAGVCGQSSFPLHSSLVTDFTMAILM